MIYNLSALQYNNYHLETQTGFAFVVQSVMDENCTLDENHQQVLGIQENLCTVTV